MSKLTFDRIYRQDFDIAGANYDVMLPDAEILTIACQVLESLEIQEFTIKVSFQSQGALN